MCRRGALHSLILWWVLVYVCGGDFVDGVDSKPAVLKEACKSRGISLY